MGYRWRVGVGRKVKFWEDLWLGSASLAVQYWELYTIVNEQTKTIAEVWDDTSLRCTFRRCVDRRLYHMWLEVCSIAKSIVLSEEEDELIWQHHSSGVYSSHSLYSIVNFREVTPMYIPVVWKFGFHLECTSSCGFCQMIDC
jgi:hypothetical protein